MTQSPRTGVRFVKGHGTENDFVLLHDPEGRLELSPSTVAALCDRRSGIGGDGLIRVVRAAALAEFDRGHVDGGDIDGGDAEWFMDYRNADGSPAQMCGNGTRVFAAYLAAAGLVDLPEGAAVRIGTRAGIKTVRREGAEFVTDLGPWFVPGGADAAGRGADSEVSLTAAPREAPGVPLPALSVDVGNPHTVVALPDADELAAADLRTAPVVAPVPPQGTNVELVVPCTTPAPASGTWRCGYTSGGWGRPGPAAPVSWRPS